MKSARFENFEEIEDRLKRVKTVFIEPQLEDILIKEFCPDNFDENLLRNYEIELKCLQKFNHDFSNRLRFNALNLNFHESRLQANKINYIMWGNNNFNIIVPLKKPKETKLTELQFGFISVQVSNVPKDDPIQILLHQNEGESSFLSSLTTSNTMSILLPEYLTYLCQQSKDLVKVLEMNYRSENRIIEAKLEFNSIYLTTDLSNDDFSLKIKNKENKTESIDGNVTEDKLSQIEKIVVNVIFIPALTISTKFNNYLIPSNSTHQQYIHKYGETLQHFWVENQWWNENKILNRINSTDQKLRLRAAIGLYKLCQNDSELNFLSVTYFKHNLLTLIDSDLDNSSVSWQRKSLFSCFVEQLKHLKTQLQQKYFVNYFINDFNLLNLTQIGPESLRKAIEKLSLLVSSKIMLLTAIGKKINSN